MQRSIVGSVVLAGFALAPLAFAHTPVCNCFDNGDDTITCEGGFSDGSSATGVAIRVLDARDRVLIDGKIDVAGSFMFMKPAIEYHVVFDAGQSHIVTIDGGDITE